MSVIATTAVGAPDTIKLLLGTSPPGGGFTPFGDAFAPTINERQHEVVVEPVFTKGSLENIPMLEEGRLGLGLAGGEATFEALTGSTRSPAALSIIAPMYSSAGMFAVPGLSAVTLIIDLKGKPVVFGAPGSSLVVQARYILKGIGLDLEHDFQAILLPRDDEALAMLADGRAAALWGGGIGWPAFEDLARSGTGARFVAPNEAESAAIVGKVPFLKRLTVPAGTYNGQNEPIHSVGSWSVVLGRSDMPERVAYALARALHEGEADMARRVRSGRETTAANTWVAAPRAEFIHPGVRRYLAEAAIEAPIK
ncbi:hypothetical protein MPEAHAMD_7137 [Methylobacterium frigidaeris]|uniref:Immunogenic protein n=2 Tax=Methylobacterium frigidaeris TaxID=2038277 RepID=A0AA37M8L8_9HYPH|nr:hypothetical protein MPEAHAMD_7137 [Methylobacterium frigidaeris]